MDDCYDTNRVILQRTTIPDVGNDECTSIPTRLNCAKLKKSIKAVIRKMVVEELHAPNFIDSYSCKFKLATSPGFSATHILKVKTKKGALKYSLSAASNLWNKLEKISRKVKKKADAKGDYASKLDVRAKYYISARIPGRGVYEIGARNKRDDSYEEFEFASSRVVHMPEFHNEILMAPWVDNITRFIKNRYSGPIYIGNSIADYTRLDKDFQKGRYFYEGDWKRFDSTLYLRICTIAVGILRQFYNPDDIRCDTFFCFLCDRICINDYYLPGGRIVRMLHGLPSGTKCTSLLGSIINLLCLNYCLEDFKNKNFSFAVGEDDFLVISKIRLSQQDIAVVLVRASSLGMNFKFFHEKFIESEYLADLPYFYKYSVRGNKPVVNPKDSLLRVSCPWNKNYRNAIDYFNFLEAQFPLLGYPNMSLLPFYSLYTNLYNTIKISPTPLSVGKGFERHKTLYLKLNGRSLSHYYEETGVEIYTFLTSFGVLTLNYNVKKLLGLISKDKLQTLKFKRR